MTIHLKRVFAWRHPRRAVAATTAVILGFSTLIAGGTAEAATASNYASSHATGGQRWSFDVAFQTRQLYSDSIGAYNEADASSSNCHGCRSVAIAFQIVADGRVPNYTDANNYASAVNYNCVSCQTLGVAYQFVIAKPVVLTWYDQMRLWAIDWQLWALEWSNAPVETIAGQVQQLANETAGILAQAGNGYWPLVRHFLTWQH